ncbi:MAG TPA: TonB-dependent receptor [Polyangiaceae bacterium]
MKRRAAPVALAALAFTGTAAAQSESAATDTGGEVEEVSVRGGRAANFESTASERDSARELTDAASLVEPMPGVHVRRLGADDAFTTLSVRGSASTEVAVLLAGVPLTGGADPSLDLSSLPLWPGAVAHVHRSFAPASLGPGSLGGTLVLDPPRANAPVGTDVWAGVGSFGEARLRMGDVRDLGGGGRVATGLSASRADDDFTYLDPGTETFVRRSNAGHAAVDGLASWWLPVAWSRVAPGALTVTVLLQDRRQQLPGTVLGPTPLAFLESDRELASAELTGALGRGTWLARGWGRREGLDLHDVDESAAVGPTRADQTIVGTGGAVGWKGRPAEGVRLEATVDGSGERFAPGLVEGAPPPPGATRASAGAGIDADWRATHEAMLAASGRVDGWADASSDGTRSGEVRPTGHVGGELALDAVTFDVHGGATARPPSFVELYGDRGAFLSNPSLLPESAWTIDAGARSARRIGPFRFAAEVAGFATWAHDLITFVPQGAFGRERATNVGQARLAGLEADLRASAGPAEVRAAYTGLLSENDDASACEPVAGTCIHPQLPGRPANDFVGDALLHAGPAVLRAGVDAITGMVVDAAGSIRVPPRVLASAGARVDVVQGVRLALDVRNLFDVRTGTYAGALGPVRYPIGDSYDYPLPGRSFLVTARFTERSTR